MTSLTPSAGQHLTELSVAECWRLAAEQQVGRLVWDGQDGLTAVPVNYAVVDQVVLIRTAAYSAITRECDDSVVAFEVDAIDPSTRTGWSVLLRGRAELATADAGDVSSLVGPWPEGLKPVHLRLDPHLVTGRRLVAPAGLRRP